MVISKRRHFLTQIACFLFLLFSTTVCVFSQKQDLSKLRVGFFEFNGYHQMDSNGNRSGYGYDLLQHVVGYTNWQLEYVGYDNSWGEMLTMLENNEIDLLTSAQMTPERLQMFGFSASSIGTSAAILTVKAGNTKYISDSYSDLNGITVGMLEGNSRNDSFKEFATENNFSYTPVYFNDTDEMISALMNEKVEAALTSNLRAIKNEWILAKFNSSPFYIIVRKDNPELLSEVDRALEHLFLNEPELCSELMSKYYTPDSGDEIPFTAEERVFIKDMNFSTFTAIINPDRAPFSYFKDEKQVGIITDIAQTIIDRSKLNVLFITPANIDAYRRLSHTGIPDICFDMGFNYSLAENDGYRLTKPYLNIDICTISRRNKTQFKSVALQEDSNINTLYGDYFKRQYSSIVYYSSQQEVIDAILNGKQDIAYLYRQSGEMAVQQDVTNRLKIEDFFGQGSTLAIGVNSNCDHLLYSIISKSLQSITQEELNSIAIKHTTLHDNSFSFIGFIYNNTLTVVLCIFITFTLIIFSFILVATVRKRKSAAVQLEHEKRRNQLLADALSSAEKSDLAKSQFLSRVSHEMRTPLNAIIGFMELAKDADVQQTKVFLSNSDMAAKQLLSVINDVLDMSAIESGKIKLSEAPFDFKHLISTITNIYYPICQQKKILYETRMLTPIDEWLIGDQLRVNQVILNLLSNAVKFTSKGHVFLKISQQERTPKELFIRLEVEDTGCGMSDDMRSRLFKPFEQQDALTAQKYGGSGLGLSIVKNLVSMMDGAICVESELGKGSRFIIDLPFIKSEINSDKNKTVNVDHMRVLSVDDEENERKYVSVVLNRIGVRHTSVSNCNEALKELNKGEKEGDVYNVCLVDWRMPDVDGIETTRRIREKYGEDLIVIIVSAYEQNFAHTQIHEVGANMFIPKPLFQSTLFDLFMTLTGGKLASNKVTTNKQLFTDKRVLLAEDNAMNRIVAEGLLNKLNVECESVSDGKLAVDKFLKSTPGYYSAILMDIQMPNMNGFEATRAIRTSNHTDAKDIQIIALTANAFNEDISKALSSGMNAHVAKPIEPDILADTLRKAFGITE